MKSVYKHRRVKKVLFEVRSDIFNRNRDLVGNKICSSSIFDEIGFKIVNDREVGTMNFFGSDPKNFLFIKLSVANFFDKFSIR